MIPRTDRPHGPRTWVHDMTHDDRGPHGRCKSRRSRATVESLESRRLLTTALQFIGLPAFSGAGDFEVDDVAVGRFNGDAYPDLVVAPYVGNGTGPGEVKILLNNGNGTFTQTDLKGTETLVMKVVVADVNNDGKSDVVALQRSNVDAGNNRIAVLLGNGNGTLQPAVFI